MRRRGALLPALAAVIALAAPLSVPGADAPAAGAKATSDSPAPEAKPPSAKSAAAVAGERSASIVVDRPGGARRLAATVPAEILDDTFPRRAGGGRRIVQLVVPASESATAAPAPARSDTSVSLSIGSGGGSMTISDGRAGGAFSDSAELRWLVWIDPTGNGRVEIVRRDIPRDVRAIDAFDRDGDGNDEIALWRPGGIWIVRSGEDGRPDGPLEPLVAEPDLDPASQAARALCASDCLDERRLWTEIVGSLRAYGPGADGTWGRMFDIPLPVTASRETHVLTLTSPTVRALPAGPGGRRLLAIGPEPFGVDRLRTLLVDPALPPETPPVECWSRLPGPEALVESAYMWIGGKPALIVTSRSSVKLGIFAEKWLRVFYLAEDRTRRGAAPALALETKMNLWQSTTPRMLDVDGDGREDLVLPYWKGLKTGHVEIDAYLAGEDGALTRSARTTGFEVENADRSYMDFGKDLDGDGRADLVLYAEGKLTIHAGSARSKKGDGLVEPAPRFSLPLEPEGAIRVNMPKGSGDGGDDDEYLASPSR